MRKHFTLTVLTFASLLATQAASAESLDTHIRATCPEAAAWKDQHEKRMPPQPVGSAANTPTQPALRSELNAMAERDQQARQAWEADGYAAESKAFAKVHEVDLVNLPRLRRTLTTRFPTASEVGVDGVQSTWLLLQHADTDPSLQERTLRALDPTNLPEGIGTKEYAMLVDRVQINLQKPQVYGSQFRQVGNEWVPYPIDKANGVDRRREALGLIPLRLYACVIAAMSTYKGN